MTMELPLFNVQCQHCLICFFIQLILLPKAVLKWLPNFFPEEVSNWGKKTNTEIGCLKFHNDTVIAAGCIISNLKKVTLQMLHFLYCSFVTEYMQIM